MGVSLREAGADGLRALQATSVLEVVERHLEAVATEVYRLRSDAPDAEPPVASALQDDDRGVGNRPLEHDRAGVVRDSPHHVESAGCPADDDGLARCEVTAGLVLEKPPDGLKLTIDQAHAHIYSCRPGTAAPVDGEPSRSWRRSRAGRLAVGTVVLYNPPGQWV